MRRELFAWRVFGFDREDPSKCASIYGVLTPVCLIIIENAAIISKISALRLIWDIKVHSCKFQSACAGTHIPEAESRKARITRQEGSKGATHMHCRRQRLRGARHKGPEQAIVLSMRQRISLQGLL